MERCRQIYNNIERYRDIYIWIDVKGYRDIEVYEEIQGDIERYRDKCY